MMTAAVETGSGPSAAVNGLPVDALRGSLEDELLKSFGGHEGRTPAALFAAVVIAGLAIGEVDSLLIGVWLLLVLMSRIVRHDVGRRVLRDSETSPEKRLHWLVLASAFTGGAMALSTLVFPWLTEMERAVISMIHIGMAAGTIATTLGYRPMVFAYNAPPLLMLIAAWLLTPFESLQPWVPAAIALLIALLGAIILSLSRDTYAAFCESFEIRNEKNVLNERLRDAVRAADSASRAKTRFLAAASHDLRQPLHALSMLSGTLLLRKLDERSAHIAEQINSATNDLSVELDALLDISKLDAGVVQPKFSSIDLQQVTQRLVEAQRTRAQSQGLTLELTSVAPVYVRADRLMLERILRNLVDNAIKYTRHGGISISLGTRQASAVVAVTDTGIGLSRSDQERVFEEFYQVGNVERSRRKGLGLGLSIVKRLVELQGGSLTLESSVGQGSTFSVLLPMAEPIVEQEAISDVLSVPPAATGVHVLVVDDDRSVRQSVKTLLEEAGCRVVVSADGEEARAALSTFEPQIVLADLQLAGGESGVDVIRVVRERHPLVEALLVSGVNEAESIKQADLAGVRLLHKPVNSGQLLEEVGRAGESRRESGAGMRCAKR